jgi:hypothetical protein
MALLGAQHSSEVSARVIITLSCLNDNYIHSVNKIGARDSVVVGALSFHLDSRGFETR